MITLYDLEDYAEREVTRTRELLASFSAEINGIHPSHTMEWSLVYFEAAAKNEVYRKVLLQKGKRDISDEAVVIRMSEYALENAINGARWPERSSSPISHVMKECTTQAWANLYCLITGRM
jgi:hypothetical protein